MHRVNMKLLFFVGVLLLHLTAAMSPDGGGLRGIKRLPFTRKGERFYSCIKHLANLVDSSGEPLHDFRVNGTAAPLSDYIDRTVGEQIAFQMSNTDVEAFCSAAQNPAFSEAMRRRGLRGSIGLPPQQGARANAAKATPASFGTGFVQDPRSGIYRPHDAEYPPVTQSLATMFGSIPAGGFDQEDAKTRSNTENLAANTIACVAFEIVEMIINTVCAITGSTGTWEGVGAGAWQAPAELVCLALQVVDQAAQETCKTFATYADFIDGEVDAAEIQASYENGMKTMDNQLTIWNKIDKVEDEMKKLFVQLFATLEEMNQVSATQNCELKSKIAAVQRENNYLRFLLTTPEGKRTTYGASTNKCPMAEPAFCQQPAYRLSDITPFTHTWPACIVSEGVY